MPSEDSELAAKCKRGDRDAYAELAHRHRKAVYRVAFAIVGDHDEAQDVVQEAFVRGFVGIGTFNLKYPFADWIRRITVNCALSCLRRQKRAVTGNTSETATADGGADPAEQAATTHFYQAVREAIEALPLRQRIALTLFALEDMDLASTAKAMGCAVGTVKAHIHRGRQKLRHALAEYLDEDGLT